MAGNRLLYEIVRGMWCLDTQNISAYLPIIDRILAGEQIGKKQELASVFSYLDDSGNSFLPREVPNSFSGYARIELVGEMTRYGDQCSYGATDYIHMLDQANKDPKVKGIVLVVDGPGGSVSAIGDFITFSKRKAKPIVALANLACSLHYWIMSGVADYILAENDISARFGSIGVVCTFADVRGMYEKKGIKLHEILPPESEHKNQSFHLAMEGKYDQIIEEELSPLAQKFQNAVRQNRPNLKEEVGVLTGKTFGAEKSKELGLIDAIGDLSDAVAIIDSLYEIKYKSKTKFNSHV